MPQGNDDWNSFDWETWGAETHDDKGPRNGRGVERSDVLADLPALESDEWQTLDPEAEHENNAPGSGHWVRQGGIISWEDDADEDSDARARSPRAEAQSVWAEDDLDMPPGAPDHLRVRAARAWIARQRALEEDALGLLLLERRRMNADAPETDALDAQERRETTTEDGPLDLALVEHQSALEAYDQMLGALDDITTHTGPAAALVEFYLWLTEELARLAMAPEAPADFTSRLLLAPVESEEGVLDTRAQPATPRSKAQWQGRAEAAAQARKRVEQVSALDPED